MDRENVIKDLEEYRDREFVKEGITVFDNDPRYRKLIIGNALALLKEQEAVKPSYSRAMNHFVCPSCSLVLDEGRDDYCPECGKKIAWDETDD